MCLCLFVFLPACPLAWSLYLFLPARNDRLLQSPSRCTISSSYCHAPPYRFVQCIEHGDCKVLDQPGWAQRHLSRCSTLASASAPNFSLVDLTPASVSGPLLMAPPEKPSREAVKQNGLIEPRRAAQLSLVL
jgi:hypothetical protein